MGCICVTMPRQNQIKPMHTRNKDLVFTSTEDISKIYVFGKVLGVGSFGKVIAAKMRSNPMKQYAIKIIEKKKVKGREDILANEIYILQKLDHPNIIKFHEVYQNRMNFYICMDYCKGGELVEWIPKKYKSFHEKNIQEIMKKIISAVAYIHSQGIVHRDIKAENIMIANKKDDAEPKLIDFGLANKFDTLKLQLILIFIILYDVQNHLLELQCIWLQKLFKQSMMKNVIFGLLVFYYLQSLFIINFTIHYFQVTCLFMEKPKKNYMITFKEPILHSHIMLGKVQVIQPKISQEECCKRVLAQDHQRQIYYKITIKHEWFTKMVVFEEKQTLDHQISPRGQISPSNSNSDNRSIYQMLKQTASKGGSKFRKEVMTILVKQLNEQELSNLIEKFKLIDVDNSGTITIFELRQALIAEGSPASFDEIERLVENITPKNAFDVKQRSRPSVELKYSEFLASCIDERKFLTREKLWSLFKFFDTDNSNYITKDDIKEAFARNAKSFTDEQIEEMIYEIDPNHDNKISFEEFCQMFDNAGIYQKLDDDDEVIET